jgi:hypothetical protein
MRFAALLFAVSLQAAAALPALAQDCDTRCDEGEVWSDAQETCVPAPKPMS